jgi:sarcosine dehydrogenase
VARLSDETFYIVTGTGFRTHDYGWIRDHIPAGADARLIDVTEQFGTLSLMGPRARDILQAVTKADVSNAAMPFGAAREISIAGANLRALRVTYVGELGWELHVPISALGDVYDALMAADPHLKPVGYRALESLRLEKAYRAWGSDITPNDTPFEAGLGWAVKLKSETPFMGRAALEAVQNKPLNKRLCGFTCDDPHIVLLGRETILRDGEPVGYLSSGGWGYTAKTNIGFGYVKRDAAQGGKTFDGVSDDWLASGHYSLVVAMDEVPATLQMKPVYDPESKRVKA